MAFNNLRYIRKSIHFFTGLAVFLLSILVERELLLWLIVLGSLFSFFTFPYNRFYILHKTEDASLGTLFYPLGILGAFLVLYHKPIYYFHVALMVLIVSDTLANLIGQIKNGNGWFKIIGDRKSMHGIAGYALSALILLFIFLPLEKLTDPFYLALVLMLAVFLEIISFRGSDNFTIPFGLALFFSVSESAEVNYTWLSLVLAGMSVGAFFLYKLHLLTLWGTLAAWLLGNFLLGGMGYAWALPVIAFFLSSVAFTRLRSVMAEKKRKRSTGRNAWQVSANIIWAVLSALFFLLTSQGIFIFLFIVFVAAVTADTWASEIGPIINKRSFSLADGRWHAAGTTGGVSPAGTLASLAGAMLIAALSLWLFLGYVDTLLWSMITVSAFAGSMADTLLGAFVEDRLLKSRLFAGKQGLESLTANDMVNMGGSFAAGIVFFFWWMW